jgi:hypothetical protein
MNKFFYARRQRLLFQLWCSDERTLDGYRKPAWRWRISAGHWKIEPYNSYAQRQCALVALQNAARERCRVALLASDLHPLDRKEPLP